jgi:hypothetical protein
MRVVIGIVNYLKSLARELSDETAYARHLSNHSVPHSAEEWRRFSDARLRRKYQQGKCC